MTSSITYTAKQTKNTYKQSPSQYKPTTITSRFQQYTYPKKWGEYFQTLGDKFIVAGDFNAKHTLWGSRINTPRGRTLEQYIRNSNLNVLSAGKPTYWPTGLNKLPDLLDFAVIKGINTTKLKITTSLELNSDHSPIIIKYTSKPILYNKTESLCNKTSNWQTFKELIENKINCNIPLKTPEHIEQAIVNMTEIIQEAAWTATTHEIKSRQSKIIPQVILDKIRGKRKAKATWQKQRTRENKQILNKLTKELKIKIREHHNIEFTKFIESLSANENTNYSLWKTTKRIKKPIKQVPAIRKEDNTWARSNEEQAEEFANHLCSTFTPHNSNSSNLNRLTDDETRSTNSTTDNQYTIPKTTAQEIRIIIKKQQGTRN